MAALLFISSNFNTQLFDVDASNPQHTARTYSIKVSEEKSDTNKKMESAGATEKEGRSHDKENDVKGSLPEDDGVVHHFHLERVRKARKHVNTLCALAKIVIAVIHIALMICCYCHVIHL